MKGREHAVAIVLRAYAESDEGYALRPPQLVLGQHDPQLAKLIVQVHEPPLKVHVQVEPNAARPPDVARSVLHED